MATIEGMNPALLAAFQAMVAASPFKLGIGSGVRTRAQQQDLYDDYLAGRGPLAAPPGSSNHESGNAIDIEYFDNDAAVEWVHQNAARFGLHFPVRGENWHAELVDGQGNPNAGLDQDALRFNLTMNGEPQKPEDVLSSRMESIMDILTQQPAQADTPADVTQPGELAQDVTMVAGGAPSTRQTAVGTAAAGDQLGNARTIMQVGRSMGMPDRAIQIGIAAALVESNLKNVNYGDRDSLGILQQRPSQGWGTPQQVMDPAYAARKFFEALGGIDWQGMDPGAAAQAVQRSAYPDRYGQRWSEAQSIFNQISGL